MYDFLILISRYLFVIYIAVFIIWGLVFVVGERSGNPENLPRAVASQRTMIILMHITAYAILCWDTETNLPDIKVIISGAGALVYLFVSSFLLRKIYKHGCPLIWNCMYFLMDIGLIMLQRLNPELAAKQLIWIWQWEQS